MLENLGKDLQEIYLLLLHKDHRAAMSKVWRTLEINLLKALAKKVTSRTLADTE